MPDREKVIKGLENTEIMLKQAVDRGGEMAVMGAFKCYNHVSDALALLKEQEATIKAQQFVLNNACEKLKEQKIAMEPKNIDKVGGNCPVCGLRMARSHKYCYQCGQEIDWE